MDSRSQLHPTIMAPETVKSVIEAARATALAAHCAAGLAASARLRQAERLLRAAEALSRSAVAALTYPSLPSPAVAAEPAGSAAALSARARRRHSKREKGKMGASSMPVDVVKPVAAMDGISVAAVLPAAPPLESPAAVSAVVADPPRRALKATTSRERSPRRISSPSASSTSAPVGAAPGSASMGLFAVGQTAVLEGLASRPKLTGSVSILSYDAVVGRYGVSVDATGEKIKVKEANLRASSCAPHQ